VLKSNDIYELAVSAALVTSVFKGQNYRTMKNSFNLLRDIFNQVNFIKVIESSTNMSSSSIHNQPHTYWKIQAKVFSQQIMHMPLSKSSVETRHHKLHKCERHKQSWNSLRSSISDIITFLKFDPRAFSFQDNIS